MDAHVENIMKHNRVGKSGNNLASCEYLKCPKNMKCEEKKDGMAECICIEGFLKVSSTCVDLRNDFELFHNRVIRRVQITDQTGDYNAGMAFCDNFNAVPFIPKTPDDYKLYSDVHHSWDGLEYYMWLPLNDRTTEGVLRWYNDMVAVNTSLFSWQREEVMSFNGKSRDCAFYGNINGEPKVHMLSCTKYEHINKITLPVICERL